MKLRLPIEWKLPNAIESRLGDNAGRQRAMLADEHLLLVLHEPPDPGDNERGVRLFWCDPKGVWRANHFGEGARALHQHVAAYLELTERLEGQLDAATTAADYFSILREATPLQRSARNFHAALQQAREMVPADRDLINARDQAGEIERSADLLHSDAKTGLDYTNARHNESQAERTYEMAVSAHRLNLLMAAFFPVATLGTVFGMNVSQGLNNAVKSPLLWAVLAAGLMCGMILAAMIARKPVHPARKPRKNVRKASAG